MIPSLPRKASMRHKTRNPFRTRVLSTKASLVFRRIGKKKKKRSAGEGVRSLGVNNFPNVAFMGVVTFIATTQTKKLSFPLTLIRPRYYQREAIYQRIDNGRSQRTYTHTHTHTHSCMHTRQWYRERTYKRESFSCIESRSIDVLQWNTPASSLCRIYRYYFLITFRRSHL